MALASYGRRSAFTLIELLVVISIIGILLALSASATVRVIDVQRGNNSEQTVKLVSEMLDRQWQAVVDKANREPIPSAFESMLLARAGGDPRRMRVLWIKLRLRQEFPMNFNEVLTPKVLPAHLAYTTALQGVGASAKTSESSVCLLLALQQSRDGVTFDADRLGTGAIGDAYATGSSNAQGLKQIIDGFGNPIAFFRWPVRNTELNPVLPQGHTGMKDPLDPEGLLAVGSWLNLNNRAGFLWFRENIHALPTSDKFGDNPIHGHSYKLHPVVASAGRNGQFGFYPADRTAFSVGDGSMTVETRALNLPAGYLEWSLDNVYSYRLRFGARGD